ncbi:NAD-dependent epimerase/dehydratase family protein [Patescibacteria group bacterium]|nr:NAD-dependent epimerase/dehydratase family protein [Patescibacteria group bacterium]
MRTIVTGGAGFIGSNLVNELIRRGDEVIVIDNLSSGRRENINPQAQFYEEDIRDFEKIKSIFKDVDFVFHLAAFPRVQPSIKNPIEANGINLDGTLNVLVASRDAGVKKVVYTSSSAVYGDQLELPTTENSPANPSSPYGMQKYMGELYCRLFSHLYNLPTVSLRYFNVFGEGQTSEGAYALVLEIFKNQRLSGEPMTIVGDGEQRRDFIYVGDVVMANILSAQSDNVGKGEAINIGQGKNFSVNEIAKMIGGPTINLPPRVEPRATLADNSLAKKLLGWNPTVELEEWLEKYKASWASDQRSNQ